MDVVTLNAAKKYAEQLGLGGAGLQEKVNEQVNVYLAEKGTDKYKTRDNGFELTAKEVISFMGHGWNLGNTLDGHHQQTVVDLTKVYDKETYFETWYKNYKVTQSTINFVKKCGFKSIRLPITWKDHLQNGIINKNWIERVEEVVKMVLANDMYCIINVHHDGIKYDGVTSEIEATNANYLKSKAYLCGLWNQIADYFKDYNSKLIFEGMNEILSDTEDWNGTTENYTVINALNQAFVDTVRASGGNNDVRFLVCPTYGANVAMAQLQAWKMPTDIVDDKIMCSVHIYCDTISDLDTRLSNVKTNLIDNNVPTIMGEYGVQYVDNAPELVNEYMSKCVEYGIAPYFWDNGGHYRLIERVTCDVYRPDILKAITGVDMPKKQYAYPIDIPSMPYHCKLYSSDSDSIYGDKYIVICSEYPITGFEIANDKTGYYKILRSQYGKTAMFTSTDDVTYTMLFNWLDNDRADYKKDKMVLGSTSSMYLIDSNYTIDFSNNNDTDTDDSDDKVWDISWSLTDESVPEEISYSEFAKRNENGSFEFITNGSIEITTANSANAEFEVRMQVPSIKSQYNGMGSMLLRTCGKHIGSLQFVGGVIKNSNTDNIVTAEINTYYNLREKIENGVGYLYVNDVLLDTITDIKDTTNLTCLVSGYKIDDNNTVRVSRIRYRTIA